MSFKPEIEAYSTDLWDEVPKSRRFVIVEAKGYVDIRGKWAWYANPYNAHSPKVKVDIKDLFDGNKYQSDHIIPIKYVKNLQKLHGFSWRIEEILDFCYNLDTQVLIPKSMNVSKSYEGLLEYCPPFGRITGGSDLINRYQVASPGEKIVVENYCFTWEHIARKWQIYKYLDPGTKNIIKKILGKAKIARRSPQLINPHY